MNYIAECLERFRQLPEDIKMKLGGAEALLAVKEIEEKYGVNTSFVVILVAIGELSATKINEYLSLKEGLSEEDAFDVMNEMTRSIFSNLFIGQVNELPLFEDIKTAFKDELLDLLSNREKAQAFNYNVFNYLKSDASLLMDLENILNTQILVLGKENIIHEKEIWHPTIANWIKDFVRINGSGNFDNLVLANYISNAENPKKLSPAEKILLTRILKLYRNIAFFDEVTDKTPIGFWEIIPLDFPEDSPSPNKSENVIKTIQPAEKSEAVEVSAAKQTEAESSAAKLQAALNDYAPDSLEYKVIKQELERLRQAHISR